MATRADAAENREEKERLTALANVRGGAPPLFSHVAQITERGRQVEGGWGEAKLRMTPGVLRQRERATSRACSELADKLGADTGGAAALADGHGDRGGGREADQHAGAPHRQRAQPPRAGAGQLGSLRPGLGGLRQGSQPERHARGKADRRGRRSRTRRRCCRRSWPRPPMSAASGTSPCPLKRWAPRSCCPASSAQAECMQRSSHVQGPPLLPPGLPMHSWAVPVICRCSGRQSQLETLKDPMKRPGALAGGGHAARGGRAPRQPG